MLRVSGESKTLMSDELQAVQPLTVDFTAILRAARHQWPVMVSVAGLCLCLATLYFFTAARKYTATAVLMTDTSKNEFADERTGSAVATVMDPGLVDSQVEILKSEGLARSVIADLHLATDPQFMQSGNLIVQPLLGLLSRWSNAPSNAELQQEAIGKMEKALDVTRVGTSYVMEIAATTLSPSLSARIANKITDAYMVGQLDAKFQATKRASEWMQDRIAELRKLATDADSAVQTYKAENKIVDTGRGLMSDQQLSDVNTQLVMARAATADAKARLDQIQAIDGVPNATVGDALHSDVINRLRAQYVDLSAKEADLAARYGTNHGAAVNLRNQMNEIVRSIGEELKRIAGSYQSDYQVAQARETSLQQSLDQLVDRSDSESQQQVKLRELESNALTYKNLYDNFLQRLTETNQQQSFPITDARVITVASEPLKTSSPKPLVVFGGGTVLSLLLGFAVGFLRERLDNALRTVNQVEQVTGLDCLGILPHVERIETGAERPPRLEGRHSRLLRDDLGLAHHVIQAPFSRFTEGVRSLKVAADLSAIARGHTQVIGIVSALPREGKTLVSINLAELLASSGRRALIIDADLRSPHLTSTLCPQAKAGLVEVLAETHGEAEVIWTDPATGLEFLPTVTAGRITHTAELVASTAMNRLLTRLRDRYDYIIVDLPPVLPIVDVRAAAHLFDAFVLVIEWGRTSTDVIRELIVGNEGLRDRLLGAVLNNADPAMLSRRESYKGRYYGDYYAQSSPEPHGSSRPRERRPNVVSS